MDYRKLMKDMEKAREVLAENHAGGFCRMEQVYSESAGETREGRWVPAACWFNCGGACRNYALVVDNVVVRQKTDDTHPDSLEYPQQRGCLRGRSQRRHVFGADRLRYPMKRKHWQPGGGDKSLRGRDTWERISWDEALEYIASELKKAKDHYGNRSIVCPAWHDPDPYNEMFHAVLSAYGGFTCVHDNASWGSYYIAPTMGLPNRDNMTGNDRMDLLNADTIVLYACNPAWASLGNPSWYYWQAKERGVQYIFVGPEYNASANLLDARWIRVRPGTDTAFLLAVAYVMMEEDDPEKNPIIDWDFLYRYTVGFDGDHMPVDASTDENLRDYLLGKYDGQPKTPEWASEICGTPVEDIRYYAREMRKDRKVSILHSFAAARCHNADDLPQILMTTAAMGGHFGKPGHSCGDCRWNQSGNCGPPLIQSDWMGTLSPAKNPVDDVIDAPDLWETILNGKYRRIGHREDPAVHDDVDDREIDIRVIVHSNRNALQTIPGTMKGIEAHRKVDFVLTLAYSLNASAEYADIVLPVATQWETFRPCAADSRANREVIFFSDQVVPPLYEARSDQQIGEALAEKLGLDRKSVYPRSEAQRYFDYLAGVKVINEAGDGYETLAQISEEDLARWEEQWGVSGKTQRGKVGIWQLLEKGVYQVKRREGDAYGHIQYADFIADPEKHPLQSRSGKFEIYCQAKADKIAAMGRSTVKPYPTYIRPLDGYEDSFRNWETKERGEYPYQVFNPHYFRRSHTVYDNVPVLREMAENPVFLNAQDASEKGVQDGDTVLIYNQYGKILRNASLVENLMPGCIALPHGTWLELDEKSGIDKGGSVNMLCGPVCSSQGTPGYNTTLVNFEKYDGEKLAPDHMRPVKMVDWDEHSR